MGLQFRSNQLGDFLLAHHNAEPLFALRHNPILPLVGRSSQIWKINVTVLFKGVQLTLWEIKSGYIDGLGQARKNVF